MVQEQADDHRWGEHATAILDGSMWKPPANGGHNDQAHPPIHPTKYSSGEADWTADKRKLYEFIVRSFLATCSKSAVGKETKIHIRVAEETFTTTGEFAQLYAFLICGRQLCKFPITGECTVP